MFVRGCADYNDDGDDSAETAFMPWSSSFRLLDAIFRARLSLGGENRILARKPERHYISVYSCNFSPLRSSSPDSRGTSLYHNQTKMILMAYVERDQRSSHESHAMVL